MGKIQTPCSLFTCAMDEVAKIYRFSLENPFSFVQSLDRYPVTASRYSLSIFDAYLERNQKTQRRHQYTSARQFVTKRRDLMDMLYNTVVMSVAYFGNKDDLHEMHLSQIRDRCAEYSRILARMDRPEVMVNLEDDIKKMMECLQNERAKLKQTDTFVNQICPIFQYYKEVGARKNMHCSEIGGGGDSIERTNVMEKGTMLKEKVILKQHQDGNDDDEAMVLYGMICL